MSDSEQQSALLEPIAIIGMAGRFPGAADVDGLWRNLCAGVESITFFSDEELAQAGVDPETIAHPRYVKAKAMLEDAEMFDASFFKFTPREAVLMDPQQRLTLECAWHALEHAGYDPRGMTGSVGVYAGANLNAYLHDNFNSREFVSANPLEFRMGCDGNFLATRIAYKFNLKGPSITVQTACSTSLVAVNLACQSLADFQCDIALAGGASVGSPRVSGYMFEESGIASPDGHCRAFDVGARGTVPGEGVALVVLKRLDDALADGDTVHAVIRGWALNNDGEGKVGFTAPSVDGQAEVIALAQALAGINASSIGYIEAHGTGTELGDPIEIAALNEAFTATSDKKGFCAIGSIKTNFGHLDAAAGVAGLIKAALVLEHGKIPPHLHYCESNPKIDFAASPFYVNTELTDWPASDVTRRAGVSSFGIGGTNAHTVLEEAPKQTVNNDSRPFHLLVFSAGNEQSLQSAIKNMAVWLQEHPRSSLADIAYTLQRGRHRFSRGAMLVCSDYAEAVECLTENRFSLSGDFDPERSVVFMFPGQGNQYLNMGRGLYDSEPLFRDFVDRCCELLKPHLDCDLRSVMYSSEDIEQQPAAARLNQTAYAQPALFVVEYALAQLWISWGIKPGALIGHSIGEYVAACLAGVFSLPDALMLVAERGRLMQSMAPGAMLSVTLPAAELEPRLTDGLELAAINDVASAVVSGPIESIDSLASELEAEGILSHRLHTSHAFHSAMMEPMLEDFATLFDNFELNPPVIDFISNLTGDWVESAHATDPNYWVKHLRATVRFADGVGTLLNSSSRVYLEVGPGNSLSRLVQSHPQARASDPPVASMRHLRERCEDQRHLIESLGRLWLAGVTPDWKAFHEGQQRRRVPLPGYVFERKPYWIASSGAPAIPDAMPAVDKKNPDINTWFKVPSWHRHSPADQMAASNAVAGACWLLFADDNELAQLLVERMHKQNVRVIRAMLGERFERMDEDIYRLAPGQIEDYESLIEVLGKNDLLPDGIIHLWGLGDQEFVTGSEWLERCFFSPLFLARALASSESQVRLNLLLVSNGAQTVLGDETLVPEKAVLSGPARVIPLENPNVECRSIDFATAPGNSVDKARFAELLFAEACLPADCDEIAYRGNYRWRREFETQELPAADEIAGCLREQGVYVITGGLGGMGLAFADYLVEQVQARLVLTGRSAFPPAESWDDWLADHPDNDSTSMRIKRLRQIENHGGELMLASVNVTDETQMRQLVEDVIARFGRVDGVIHAAGVPSGGLIQLRHREQAEQVLAPKVAGSLVLDGIFRDRPLDFMVFCSSLSAITGTFGQVDYSAANAFQDALAHARSATGRYTLSINWDVWSDAGMAFEAESPAEYADLQRYNLAQGITSKEGGAVLGRLLDSGLAQVLVSTRPELQRSSAPELDQRAAAARATSMDANARAERPPGISQAYVAPRNPREKLLAEIWQNLFGIDSIGVEDDFFELGGHSLLAVQIVSRINNALGTGIDINNLFEAPSIARLAEMLEEPDELIDQVDGLSDEEVNRLLAEKGVEV